jgi:hypothetical protein
VDSRSSQYNGDGWMLLLLTAQIRSDPPQPGDLTELQHATTAPRDAAPLTREDEALTPAPQQLGVSGLYRDVLHHVFTFLELNEISLAARTHQRWLAAASAMKSRGEGLMIKEQWQYDALLTSLLRHHVTNLGLQSGSWEHLYLLSDAMPHLRELNSVLWLREGMPLRWPASLTRLSTWLVVRGPSLPRDASIELHTAVGRSIAKLPYLQQLCFSTTEVSSHAYFLEPLVASSSLTSVRWTTDSHDMQAMDVIRRLPHLRKFDSDIFTLEHLRRLVEGDAPIPPLEYLTPKYKIDSAAAPVILRLAPTLTDLDAQFHLADICAFLARLTKVTKLRLRASDGTPMPFQGMADGLRAMPQLTSLVLMDYAHAVHFTSDSLCQILLPLQQLRVLELWFLSSLLTLEFLQHTPHLTRLRLNGYGRASITEARHLEHLRHVEELVLTRIFESALDPSFLERITPESATWDRKTWPRLQSVIIET